HCGPNMTPMVDVVMVILIFFMASTAFLGPEWFLRTHLPKAGPAGAPRDAEPTRFRVLLSMNSQNQTVAAVGDRPDQSLDQLDALLREESSKRGPDNIVVLVSPGPQVPYDGVVRVHEICASLGIAKVGLEP